MARPFRTLAHAVLAGALALSAATPALARSGYVNNKDGWMAMTPADRVGYAQGLNDSMNFIFVDDALPAAIIKYARTRCLLEMKMTPVVLADVITTAYQRTPQFAGEAPLVVYVTRLNDICKRVITEERARFGLPPM